jgi:hypothetical protein
MSLWHWLVGGAAAYWLYSKTGTAAASAAGAAPNQTAVDLRNTIINHVTTFYAKHNTPPTTVVVNIQELPGTGFQLVDAYNNNTVMDSAPTLEALWAAIKTKYPIPGISGYGYSEYLEPSLLAPMTSYPQAPAMSYTPLRDPRRFRR